MPRCHGARPSRERASQFCTCRCQAATPRLAGDSSRESSGPGSACLRTGIGEIAARLWDVTPGGEQRLISRGVWRIGAAEENATTTITFQLHGNGYEFPAGDTVKLQLLGRDAPYYRASNGTFAIEASNVTVTLPTT